MHTWQPVFLISRSDYDAVLFDLDGVVTQTAKLHTAAWETMFNAFLKRRAERLGEAYRPFDAIADYRAYIDGKPRCDGVASFGGTRHRASLRQPNRPSGTGNRVRARQ